MLTAVHGYQKLLEKGTGKRGWAPKLQVRAMQKDAGCPLGEIPADSLQGDMGGLSLSAEASISQTAFLICRRGFAQIFR